jgi:hypothetical protein
MAGNQESSGFELSQIFSTSFSKRIINFKDLGLFNSPIVYLSTKVDTAILVRTKLRILIELVPFRPSS